MSNELKQWAAHIQKMEAPKELDIAIDQAIQKAKQEKNKIRRPNYKKPIRTFLFFASSAAVLMACMIGPGFISTSWAEALSNTPLLGKIFKSIGDLGLKEASKQGLASSVQMSTSSQGITLNISEVLYDGTRLSLGYMEESSQPLPAIDKKKPRFKYVIDGWDVQLTSEAVIDQNHHIGVMNLRPLEAPDSMPDPFHLELKITQIGDIQGEWDFTIPVKKNDSKTKFIQPKIVEHIGDTIVLIDTVTFSPRGTELNIRTMDVNESDVINTTFTVSDEQGRFLELLEGSGYPVSAHDDKRVTFKSNFLFTPVSPKTSVLILHVKTPEVKDFQIKIPVK
ncbi:DUF4179 domain-containing protein [Brevibacillus sp. H7]|uniref:DUF4179 domain-containing protein n=1 Tax=Brevibacillus sp. H7 TaxID=3349138 RepID=UPI0037FB6C4E